MRSPTSPDTVLVHSSPVTPRNEPRDAQPQEFTKGPRIAYSVVSIFCMLLLATMLGEACTSLCDSDSHACVTLTVYRFANPYFHWSQEREISPFHSRPRLLAIHIRHHIRRHCSDSAVGS
jgi:hypothetical protein